ncbi:thioesterase II family protein [Paenibacillus bouchesdurhonensis]|uniref:thioesterase II family protein n=1 Tax=Paenibacillus bouchesdurhonensis TaxID=1870990 RepID=UPI000DA608EB|nr:alpha/beta fold hydrolase [Paenibacillus bouchesdurhonensis]
MQSNIDSREYVHLLGDEMERRDIHMSIGKLICIAHAGGSASSYLRWSRYFDANMKVVPLEYAGRGVRSSEKLYNNMNEAVADLVDELKPHLADGIPYALFGHSLGALAAYELACELQKSHLLMPTILVVSGRNPPHMRSTKKRHELPEAEFREELITMGGTPSELLQDKSFAEYFIPIARSDFKLAETYQLQSARPKLHTNVGILNGMADEWVDLEHADKWGDYCEGIVWNEQFPGGHFYLHESPEQVALFLNRRLAQQPVW